MTLLLKFLKVWWKGVVGFILGAFCLWYIQGLRVEAKQNQILKVTSQYEEVLSANKECGETVNSLESEVGVQSNMCQARLKEKDKFIAKIKKQFAQNNRCQHPPQGDDSVLRELNGMFPEVTK